MRCDVDFAAQTPWIFNGTVEENILFNRKLDKERLDKCIKSCYLTKVILKNSRDAHPLCAARIFILSAFFKAGKNILEISQL